jgi:hypothetical protein
MSASSNRAFLDGIKDGLDWDLGGFKTVENIHSSGWDDATIDALGDDACREAWGIPEGEAGDIAWREACEAYNRGACMGACAPQSVRTGRPLRRATADDEEHEAYTAHMRKWQVK